MSDRYEVRMAGSGSHGLVTAGLMLADAASRDGQYALHTQVRSEEISGGACVSDVIISSAPITYPKLVQIDVLIATTLEAYCSYVSLLSQETLLILEDSCFANLRAPINAHRIPLIKVAERVTGTPALAGVVALGVLTRLTSTASREAITCSVRERTSEGNREDYLLALLAGFGEAVKVLRGSMQREYPEMSVLPKPAARLARAALG